MTPGSSQTLPTGQPAGQIKKLHLRGYISVRTTFSSVCTFDKLYVTICTLNISCSYFDIHACKHKLGNRHVCTCLYIVCTCLHKLKHICTCINMYIQVWTMYKHVYTSKCIYMYIPCIYMFIDFHNCIHMYIQFIKCMYMSERCIWCVCTIA